MPCGAQLNERAIAVDQDPLGKAGGILAGQDASTPLQVWHRPLVGGAVAVGLYNKGAHFHPPPIPPGPCKEWVHNATGYYEATGGAGGDLGSFHGLAPADAQAKCCANPACAGFSYRASDGAGYWKRNAAAGFVPKLASGYEGYTRPSQVRARAASPSPCVCSRPPTSDAALAGIRRCAGAAARRPGKARQHHGQVRRHWPR